MEKAADSGSVSLLASRELASLFQEEFVAATGLAARWAAERVQGNRRLEHSWKVPFDADGGVQGSFTLYWDAELQRFLAGRLGTSAARPEYLGSVLRSVAGSWASWQSLRSAIRVRLQPTLQDQDGREAAVLARSSAALIADSFVIELVFALESREG